MWSYDSTFRQRGFAVVPAENMDALNKLRQEIFEHACKIFNYKGEDCAAFFNNFHSQSITGAKLNDLRVQLIKEVTNKVDSGRLIFEAFRSTILELLGPDLLVQKNTNLVIQQPNDPNPSELHRDAPANSPFEIVVWLPLVDAYGTKAMYVCDKDMTESALSILDTKGYSDFDHYAKTNAPSVPVPYGSGLFFWTALLHGSHINREQETRWTLNMRFKNLFSPNGDKEPFEFFKVFQLSPLAQLGTQFLKQRDLG